MPQIWLDQSRLAVYMVCMPYRVLQDGSIICTSPEEAMQLSEKIRATQAPPATLQAKTIHPIDIQKFVNLLNENQIKALKIIKSFKSITLGKLTIELNQKNNNATGGVMAGIVRLSMRYRVDINQLYIKESVVGLNDPKNTVTYYKCGNKLEELNF